MRRLFQFLALVSALLGFIQLYFGFATSDTLLFVAGIMSVLYAYAWDVIGEMYDRIAKLEHEH